MLSKKFKTAIVATVAGLAVMATGANAFAAGSSTTVNNCIHSQNIGWISCPVIDSLRGIVAELFNWLIENWLLVSPKLLAFSANTDPGEGVHFAWQYFQVIANTILFGYLIVIILSQITGLGISNYGIKQALPRVVLAAILINLSYVICQAAVDVANIVGHGIFDIMDSIIENSGIVATGRNDTGYSIALVAILAAVIGIIIKAVLVSPAIISIAFAMLITAFFAIMFLFIILGLRQVMTVLLVAISPLAILCSTIPGLRSLYQKWFNLLKGLLLAYPICSFMIGGGGFASQVLYDVWGADRNFFAAVACMIICVAPFFFIPSVVQQSIGALNSLVDKVRHGSGRWRGLETYAQNAYKGSDLSRRLDMASKKKKVYRRAGIKSTFWGQAKYNEDGSLQRTRFAGGRLATRYYKQRNGAFDQLRREREALAIDQDEDLVRNTEDQHMIDEYIGSIGGRTKDEQKLEEGLVEARKSLVGASNDKETREARAKVAAYTKLLSRTADGRKRLDTLLSKKVADDSDEDLIHEMAEWRAAIPSMFAGFNQGELNQLMLDSPMLGNYGALVRSGAPYGDYADFKGAGYTAQMFEAFTGEDWAKLDQSIKQEVFQEITDGMVFDPDSHKLTNDSGFTVKDNELSTMIARLCSSTSSDVDLMAQNTAASRSTISAFMKQRGAQVAAYQSSYQSSGLDLAGLGSAYSTAAAGGRAIEMEAAAEEMKRLGITPDGLESLRKAAEVMNQNASLAVALGRAKKR